MVAGYIWARVYAFGLRHGVPGVIWYAVAAIQLTQLGLVRAYLPTLSSSGDNKKTAR